MLKVIIPPAKQKVDGIDVSKDSLAISYLVEEKVLHLEKENTKLVLGSYSSNVARKASISWKQGYFIVLKD